MQLVVPHETVRAGVVRSVDVIGVAGDVEGCGAVEVLRWVVVDVGELRGRRRFCQWPNRRRDWVLNEGFGDLDTYQPVDVHDGNVRAGEAVRDFGRVGCFVLKNGIHQRDVLEHLVADLGDVAGLVFPVLGGFKAAFAGKAVLRRQVQGRDVLEDKVAAAVVVDALDGVEDAIGVVDDAGAGYLGIRDESVVAKIVRSDEDAVHGLVWWVVHELRSVLVDVFGVGDVGGYFVLLDGWERSVDGCERAWSNVIAADGARHSVVVYVCTRILCDVLRPRTSTRSGMVVLYCNQYE